MRIAVLLSGGVDSSVALRLAQEIPHTEVTAFYLKIWLEEELAFLGDCPWEEDLNFARAVCEQAGVPLEILSFQAEYQERIVTHTLAELRRGRTPSPDILCNQRIKFGLFFDKIGSAFEKIVSGHYACVEPAGDRFLLKRSPDPVKDQTYFLSALNQEQLARISFPIGHLTKPEVRELARKFDLPNQARPDSQGICFLGKIKYDEFVLFHLGQKPGEIIEAETGRKLGQHRGYWFYTIGQRKGIGLSGGLWYVVNKEVESNRIIVSHSEHYLERGRDQIEIEFVHWISGEPAQQRLHAKLRHGPRLEECTIRPVDNSCWLLSLKNRDPGAAPGQHAVLYDGEICVGGGTIV